MILPGKITFKKLPQKALESELSDRKEQDSLSSGPKVYKLDDLLVVLNEFE